MVRVWRTQGKSSDPVNWWIYQTEIALEKMLGAPQMPWTHRNHMHSAKMNYDMARKHTFYKVTETLDFLVMFNTIINEWIWIYNQKAMETSQVLCETTQIMEEWQSQLGTASIVKFNSIVQVSEKVCEALLREMTREQGCGYYGWDMLEEAGLDNSDDSAHRPRKANQRKRPFGLSEKGTFCGAVSWSNEWNLGKNIILGISVTFH